MKQIILTALATITLAACGSPAAVSPAPVSPAKAAAVPAAAVPAAASTQKDFTDVKVLADSFLKQFNAVGKGKLDAVATLASCEMTSHTVQTAAHSYDCTVVVNDDPNIPGSILNNGDLMVRNVTVAPGGQGWGLTPGGSFVGINGNG